jgi:hypothetical protein
MNTVVSTSTRVAISSSVSENAFLALCGDALLPFVPQNPASTEKHIDDKRTANHSHALEQFRT